MGISGIAGAVGNVMKGIGFSGSGFSSLSSAFSKSATTMAQNADSFLVHNVNKSSKAFLGAIEELADDSVLKKAYKEVSEEVAKDGKQSSRKIMESIKGRVDNFDEVASGIAKDNKVFKEAMEQYNKGNDALSKIRSKGMSQGDIVKTVAEYAGNENGKLGKGQLATGFFLDETHGKTRIATAAAAYGGGALAVRQLSGGNATHNANGERDIAGIPLI